jgi:uncharacterized protein
LVQWTKDKRWALPTVLYIVGVAVDPSVINAWDGGEARFLSASPSLVAAVVCEWLLRKHVLWVAAAVACSTGLAIMSRSSTTWCTGSPESPEDAIRRVGPRGRSGTLRSMRSGWLLRDGDVVCALEVAETPAERGALRGRSSCDGALHVQGARTVHTAGMRFTIDVAFLSGDKTVVRVTRLKPWRVAIGGRAAKSAVEAEAGALERWGVRVGDQLEVSETPNGAVGDRS